MRPKAEWAIDSEPIRARGIIVKYKVYHAAVPEYLTELFRLTSEEHKYNLRGSTFDMQLPKAKTNS